MSTSNIKSPNVIRQGYVNSWEKQRALLGVGMQVLQWELNKQNVTSIKFLMEGGVLSIFYYKWAQLPFKSKVSQRLLGFVKEEANNVDAWGQVSLMGAKDNYKINKNKRRFSIIDSTIRNQTSYQIPLITQTLLSQYLVAVNPTQVKEVRFINIFKRTEVAYKIVDLKEFINETPLVKGNLKSIYHVLDMVTIIDLFSLEICGGELMGTLIGKVLERSSKKGLFIRSLRVLSKLPTLIKRFEIKKGVSVNRNWRWSMKITGKISGMGRTKIYNVFSEKMPLHTISNSVDYSETIVNTKAGTFSIKIWFVR